MAHKQNVSICNWDEISSYVTETDLIKTNWLPICISGSQWYVAEYSTFNNNTLIESTVFKIYKQGANGVIVTTLPIGPVIEGYCSDGVVSPNYEFITGCEYSSHTLNTGVILNLTGTTIDYVGTDFNALLIPTAALYITKAIVDWGDGQFEILNSNVFTTSISHTINPSLSTGQYEARVYVQTEDSEWFLVTERVYNYNQTTGVVTNVSSFSQNTSIYRFVRNLVQVINENTLAITYQNDTGTATTIGAGNTFVIDCRKNTYDGQITEPFLSNGQSVSRLSTTVTASENSSQNRITGIIANAVTTAVNPTFTGARDVTVYNSKNVTVVFEYTTTVNGVLHRVNVPSNSTWSNTLKLDGYSNEGTYVLGNIITAYGATTASGEININWTT